MFIKMNGETTKYYKFEKSGSGRITIPISLAKALNWTHNIEINITIEVLKGNKGLFLFKKEEEINKTK